MIEILTAINTILSEHAGGFIALLALIVSIIALRPNRKTNPYLDMLETRTDWAKAITRLSADDHKTYTNRMTRLSDWADGFYGQRLFGWHSFMRCLTLALLYPFFTALVGSAIYGYTTVGGLPISETYVPLLLRLFRLIAFSVAILCLYSVIKNQVRISTQLYRFLTPQRSRFNAGFGFYAKAGRVLVRIAPSLAVASAAAAAIGVAVTSAGTPIGPFFTIGVITFAASGAGPGAIPLTTVVTIFAMAMTNVASYQGSMFMLFNALLPLINALADFVSVGFTRLFIRKIASGTQTAKQILFELACDLFIALACLAGLLFALTFALDQWQALSPNTLPFDWRAYRTQVLNNEAGAWVFIATMLASTLIPTLVHVSLGAYALARHKSHHSSDALTRWERLENMVSLHTPYAGIKPEIRKTQIVPLMKSLKRAQGMGLLGASISLIVLLAGILALIYGGINWLYPDLSVFPTP